jgi:hypothetical protein
MLKGNFANKLEGPSLMRHIYKICFSKIEVDDSKTKTATTSGDTDLERKITYIRYLFERNIKKNIVAKRL